MSAPVEVSWFGALCDDDYAQLGVVDPARVSSWSHCRDIALTADRHGFDNLLLPSGYTLGIDGTAFAAGLAPLLEQLHLLLAVRCGELWVPQLARQIATLDQMLDGRLTVNIISSDLPGETLPSGPRYRRTLETMVALRAILDGQPLANGIRPAEIVLPKIEDEIVKANLRKATAIPSRSILFNIDQKFDGIGGDHSAPILEVFVKVLNELQGYYGKQGYTDY